MALQFKRSDIAEQYECLIDEDIMIHIACYSGMLSNINPCGARNLVRSNSPYIREKALPPDEEE